MNSRSTGFLRVVCLVVLGLTIAGSARAEVIAAWKKMNASTNAQPALAVSNHPNMQVSQASWTNFYKYNDNDWFYIEPWDTNNFAQDASPTNYNHAGNPITNYITFTFAVSNGYRVSLTNFVTRMLNDERSLHFRFRSSTDDFKRDLITRSTDHVTMQASNRYYMATTNSFKTYTNDLNLLDVTNSVFTVRMYGVNGKSEWVYAYFTNTGSSASDYMWKFEGEVRRRATVVPPSGPLAGGTVVTVTNLMPPVIGDGTDVTNVTIDGVNVLGILGQGTNWVRVTAPAGSTPGDKDIRVYSTSAGMSEFVRDYTYNPTGVIVSLSPTSGVSAGGYDVAIVGSNLCDGTDVTNVLFGGNSLAPSSQSATQVVVTAPAGSGTVDIRIYSTSYGESFGASVFTYTNSGSQLTITAQPTGAVVAVGQAASLSVIHGGDAPFGYQWLKDGVILTGQTNSTLAYASFQFTNSGSYYVVITNAAGMVISYPASLSASNAPLQVWGYNIFGGLGNGTTTPTNRPIEVASNVVAMAGGAYHSLFVKADGALWAMGRNNYGQLGNGTLTEQDSPVTVASNVVAAAAGETHSLFVKADGTLWAMGFNGYGQLGNGTLTDTNLPIQVTSNVVAVASGGWHSLFVKADGTLWAMGLNNYGQLGIGGPNGPSASTNLPTYVTNNVVAVAAGNQHSLFVKADGTLWAMGYNYFGQLGNGTTADTNRPIQVANGVVAVSAGKFHSLFVKADDTLWAMGNNSHGELGNGTYASTNQPIEVASNVVAIAGGSQHSLFVKTDGALWAMGNNVWGQLGDGTTTESYVPVLVNNGGLLTASLAQQPLAYHSLAIAKVLPSGMLILGTNGAAIASDEAASSTKGTVFGHTRVGSSTIHAFSITNSGVAALTISGYATNGTDGTYFAIAGLPATVSVGGVSNFTVVYTPASFGSHSASVEFTSDDPASPFTLNLAGSGYQLSTNIGPYAGGNTITITNGNFGTITNVLVGGVAATIQDSGANWVRITIPTAGSAGVKDIVIQTGSGDITLAGAYTVNPSGAIKGGGVAPGLTCLYEFNGDLKDSLSNGLDMVTVDTETEEFTSDGWRWTSTNAAGGGLQFNGPAGMASIFTNYSIGIRFRFDATGPGYRKIIDYKNRVDDNGFYFLDQKLKFYPYNLDGSNNVPNGTFVDFILTYDGSSSTIDVYTVSGTNVTREFGVKDDQLAAVPINVVGRPRYMLFMDDMVQASETTPGGTVRRIKLWDRPLTQAEIQSALSANSGVTPESGSYTGGYPVVITGTNLCDGTDVTNVTLCGVSEASIVSQSATQVVVTAGVASFAGLGDVRVYSVSFGETVKANAFTYLRENQTPLLFSPTTPQVYGTTNVLTTSGGSGTGAVGYTVLSGPGLIVDGTKLTVTNGSGTISIRATKAQDDLFYVASVTSSVTAAKANQTINFPAIDDQLTTNRVSLVATASSGLNVNYGIGGPVSVDAGPPVVLSFTGTGIVRVVASEPGNANWNAAATVTNTFAVMKATAGVTLNSLNQTYDGSSRIVTATTVPSGLSVDITYDGSSTVPVNAGRYVVTGVLNEVMYQGSLVRTLTVARANQSGLTFAPPTPQTYNTTNGLSASGGGSTGGWTFTVESGTAQIVGGTNLWMQIGIGSVTVRATKAGDANWNEAHVEATVNAAKAIASVTLTNLTQTYDGTARVVGFTSVPSVSSVLFTYNGSATAPTGVGSYSVTGTVNDAMYAGVATGILTVSQGSQTIDFAQIPNQRPTNVVHLAATASSGLPVTFAIVSGPAVLADGTNLSFTGSGSVTVRASQAGDANWHAASVVQSFRVGSGGILDFDGDGITDIGIYRTSSNTWHAFRSTEGEFTPFEYGIAGDIHIPADYDGDGFCDFAVFRPLVATWYIFGSATGGWSPMQYGAPGDLPIPADYDGDGKADFAVLRPTNMTWYIFGSSAGPMTPFAYGLAGDMPVPADYDGDGLADPAVVRPSTMTWYAFGTSVGPINPIVYGVPGDMPVPGDYDGDGRIDYAVFRPSNVTWYIFGTTDGEIPPFAYGIIGDVPLLFPWR